MTTPPSDHPPQRAPYYFSGGWFRMGSDEPQFRIKGKFEFEFVDSERGDDPALASGHYAADFARHIASEPRWRVTGGWEVAPAAVTEAHGSHGAGFVARHEATGRSVDGLIAFTPDPSHWIKVEVFLDAERVFLAYMDRVWEEFDLWPSEATPEESDEAPGRIGKRRTWVNLSAVAWPVLAALDEEGFVAIELPEAVIHLGRD
jgi:hypothetical protein